MACMNIFRRRDPRKFVRDAWKAGASVPLDGIGYGRKHWDNQQDIESDSSEWPYYRFLAGIAVLLRAKRALDIGTHWGGSARSMARGMKGRGKVVTIDISTESDAVLPSCPESSAIQKIVGDANSLEVIEQVGMALNSADILYIDADHRALPTLLNFSIYASLLRPKVAVFDDIRLNEDMARFWQMIRKAYPDRSIDCVDVEPTKPYAGWDYWIRQPEVGFGVVLLQD
jgi:cephalosporin hydroxylase